eukprot:Platyproteum_vivax@DN17374_c0_g1_i1.p1
MLGNQYLSQAQIDHHQQITAGPLAGFTNPATKPGQPMPPGQGNGPLQLSLQGVNVPTYIPGKYDLSGHHLMAHRTHFLAVIIKLLIVSYCAFIFYLIGGTYWNMKYHHLSGTDAIPHIKFWREVPALCQDGCGIFHKIASGFGNVFNLLFSPLAKNAGLPSSSSSFPSKAGYTTI